MKAKETEGDGDGETKNVFLASKVRVAELVRGEEGRKGRF